jgi:hypothetical protein
VVRLMAAVENHPEAGITGSLGQWSRNEFHPPRLIARTGEPSRQRCRIR